MSNSDPKLAAFAEHLRQQAQDSGYQLNPDPDFTRELLAGLMVNTDRYTYPACPCRLATGEREADRDIICPCDYRDPDLEEYGACFCGLYVTAAVAEGAQPLASIPERRPPLEQRRPPNNPGPAGFTGLALPVWHCRVCGYLCARLKPPPVCPICHAPADRFARLV